MGPYAVPWLWDTTNEAEHRVLLLQATPPPGRAPRPGILREMHDDDDEFPHAIVDLQVHASELHAERHPSHSFRHVILLKSAR